MGSRPSQPYPISVTVPPTNGANTPLRQDPTVSGIPGGTIPTAPTNPQPIRGR